MTLAVVTSLSLRSQPAQGGGAGGIYSLPDLTITNMRIELQSGGGCAFTSTTLGLRVEFANIGTGAAGPFVIEANGVQQTFPGLGAGGSGSLWFPNYVYNGNTATIDALGQVVESDETNNAHKKSPPLPTLPATCTPTPGAVASVTPTPMPPRGDANCDGRANSIDAALVLQYGAGLLGALPCRSAADANRDGSVNAVDAALILQYVAGLLPGL